MCMHIERMWIRMKRHPLPVTILYDRIIFHLDAKGNPVQLTVVGYRQLTALTAIHYASVHSSAHKTRATRIGEPFRKTLPDGRCIREKWRRPCLLWYWRSHHACTTRTRVSKNEEDPPIRSSSPTFFRAESMRMTALGHSPPRRLGSPGTCWPSITESLAP